MFGGARKHDATVSNNPQLLVSIVTIVRNNVKTFARALHSVVAQDYPNIEYIVIDGGSTDGTLDVIRSHDNYISKWISEPDAGISDAFNKGVALASGDVVGILNSDDWYEPGAISTAVNILANSRSDIVCGKLQYWQDDRRTYLVSSDANLLDRGMTVGHPAVFVRRTCFDHFGLFRLDFRLAMDYEWLLRAKIHGASYCSVDQCLANMQSGGIGEQFWRESQREVARARAIYLPSARGAIYYRVYVWNAIAKGTIRRALDALGLNSIRRLKHRFLSKIKILQMKD